MVKLFKHGGSQAVRLPKKFRFEGEEVLIEKRGDAVVLRPKTIPKPSSLADVALCMRENFPEGAGFPGRRQEAGWTLREIGDQLGHRSRQRSRNAFENGNSNATIFRPGPEWCELKAPLGCSPFRAG